MADNILLLRPTQCKSIEQKLHEICLPLVFSCDNTVLGGFLTECGLEWNCNQLCDADESYFIPYVIGDKLMIQVQFYDKWNDNRYCPNLGWGDWIEAELIDESGNIYKNWASMPGKRYGVGWSGDYSYQTLEFDTTDLDGCFKIRIFTDEDEVCTQFYKPDTCDDSIMIEGVYENSDCFNNYYGNSKGCWHGDPEFTFSNRTRVRGAVKYYGNEGENVFFGSNITKHEGRSYYRLFLSDKLPEFAHRVLTEILLRGQLVLIDNLGYYIENIPRSTPLTGSNMFLPQIELYRECNNAHSQSCN